MEEIFLGVMDLQEAKNHQLRLKNIGVEVSFKTNNETCTTGCKVRVELWGKESDKDKITLYFQSDYLKHIKGHLPDFDLISAVFDPSASEVTCQACGHKFAPVVQECPECGLCY